LSAKIPVFNMSKVFATKRNRSHDPRNPSQHPHTPSSRRKSLPRESEHHERSPPRASYMSEFPLQDSLTHSNPSLRRSGSPDYHVLSPREKRRTVLRHRDLKRKFVFDLHDEIQKPIHTTVLEEISDLERITAICTSTLHAMMNNKTQRKYLHHINNSNNTTLYVNLPRSVIWNTTQNSNNHVNPFNQIRNRYKYSQITT